MPQVIIECTADINGSLQVQPLIYWKKGLGADFSKLQVNLLLSFHEDNKKVLNCIEITTIDVYQIDNTDFFPAHKLFAKKQWKGLGVRRMF